VESSALHADQPHKPHTKPPAVEVHAPVNPVEIADVQAAVPEVLGSTPVHPNIQVRERRVPNQVPSQVPNESTPAKIHSGGTEETKDDMFTHLTAKVDEMDAQVDEVITEIHEEFPDKEPKVMNDDSVFDSDDSEGFIETLQREMEYLQEESAKQEEERMRLVQQQNEILKNSQKKDVELNLMRERVKELEEAVKTSRVGFSPPSGIENQTAVALNRLADALNENGSRGAPFSPGFSTISGTSSVSTMTKPRCGGYTPCAEGASPNAVWIGGKPTVTFERDPTNIKWRSEYCLRYPLASRDARDSYAYRSTKIPTFKFSRGINVKRALEALTKHLVNCGLDTVLYVRDPDDPTVMLYLPTHYTRITLEHVREEHERVVENGLWDSYLEQADNDVKSILEDLLEKSFFNVIKPKLAKDPNVSAAWVLKLILDKIQFSTHGDWDVIRKKLCNMNPNRETGVNLQEFCEKVTDTIQDLVANQQFDKNCLKWLFDAFLKVDVPLFVSHFDRKWGEKLPDILRRHNTSSNQAIVDAMENADCSWDTVLEWIEREYKNLVTGGHWKTASKPDPLSPSQAHVADGGKGKESTTEKPAPKTEPKKSEDGEEKKCYHCKKTGHSKRECPKLKPDGGNPRVTPPKEGEPHYKVIKTKNDVECLVFWCPGCNLGRGMWVSTHYVHAKKKDEFQQIDRHALLREYKENNGFLPSLEGKLPTQATVCELGDLDSWCCGIQPFDV